jgi:hypothetical protein
MYEHVSYKTLFSTKDCIDFQSDLNNLSKRCEERNLKINPNKWVHIRFCFVFIYPIIHFIWIYLNFNSLTTSTIIDKRGPDNSIVSFRFSASMNGGQNVFDMFKLPIGLELPNMTAFPTVRSKSLLDFIWKLDLIE